MQTIFVSDKKQEFENSTCRYDNTEKLNCSLTLFLFNCLLTSGSEASGWLANLDTYLDNYFTYIQDIWDKNRKQ